MLYSKGWLLKLSALALLFSTTALSLKAVADLEEENLERILPAEVNRMMVVN